MFGAFLPEEFSIDVKKKSKCVGSGDGWERERESEKEPSILFCLSS